jgi:hypothetical protein
MLHTSDESYSCKPYMEKFFPGHKTNIQTLARRQTKDGSLESTAEITTLIAPSLTGTNVANGRSSFTLCIMGLAIKRWTAMVLSSTLSVCCAVNVIFLSKYLLLS